MPETIALKAPADVEFDLEIPRPDISHLVTESEEPVDNIISEERAVTAEEKAARFAAKLRELGLDPEQV